MTKQAKNILRLTATEPHLGQLMHDAVACFSQLVVLQGRTIRGCAQEHIQSSHDGLQGEPPSLGSALPRKEILHARIEI
jgi:hypothetical protein